MSIENQIALGVLCAVGFATFALVVAGTRSGGAAPKLSAGFAWTPAPQPESMRPKGDQRRQPRWLQQLRASQGGYFWLPCALCGEHFGGHEWAGTMMLTPSEGQGVCANCVDEAARLSDAMYERSGYVLDPNPPYFKDGATGEWIRGRQWIDPKWLQSIEV